MREYLAGASVERLTEIWQETRAKDAAQALIDAKIEAERAPSTAQLDYYRALLDLQADRGAAEG